ncbi:MAG: hypothetical protein ABS59_05795 [Methylobacterium sp. SCN 67-24]|nr:MAG: hypothetical protein ABS59_05795 [Methylobacterium sp. SCN 67-24]
MSRRTVTITNARPAINLHRTYPTAKRALWTLVLHACHALSVELRELLTSGDRNDFIIGRRGPFPGRICDLTGKR